MRKIICAIIVSIMMISMFSGCGLIKRLGKNLDDEVSPVSSIAMDEDEAKRLADKMQISLYFTDEKTNKLRKEMRYISKSEAGKSVNNLAEMIIAELISGPGKNTGLKATIPEGTKLRSPVKIDAGVATVDLTKEFRDKHPGGKEQEELTIFSIVNSLTELKEIEKVKFLVDGKESAKYKGNFKFNAAFPRSIGIISKDAAIESALEDEWDIADAISTEDLTGDDLEAESVFVDDEIFMDEEQEVFYQENYTFDGDELLE